MPPSDLRHGEPSGTREAIMQATYRALCEHGYADLTIQRIGDEFEKSKSLLYHHYDGKDALLVEFLEFMLERFETAVSETDGREGAAPERGGDDAADPGPGGDDADPEGYEDARDHLLGLLDHALPATMDDERAEFTRAMVELRAQAAHDPEYRDHFTRSDRSLHRHVAGVIRRGVEAGTFRDADPERVAHLLVTTVHGGMLNRATTDDEAAIPAVREELERLVEARLLPEDG